MRSPPGNDEAAPGEGAASSKLRNQHCETDGNAAAGFTQGEVRICQLLCVIARELAELRAELKRTADQREIQLELWSRS